MEFITFVDHNQVSYLQYTGNEAELQKLYDLVYVADYANMSVDLSVRFSDYEVDHMCSLSYRNVKVNGTFKCPPKEEVFGDTISKHFTKSIEFVYMLVQDGAEWEDIIILLDKEEAIQASIKFYTSRVEIFKKSSLGYIPTYAFYKAGNLQQTPV
jgi:hypothetical protein